jgi:hypothetical protein
VWRVAVTSTDLDELPFRKLTTAGDLLYGSAANTATRLAIGSSGLPLTSTGTAPSWAQLGTSGIADGAVTTAKIGAAAVTAAKLAADTAGNGLTQAAGGALQVNPDGTTLELSADAVRVKDGGITLAKLAADSVDGSKIVNDTITVNEIANDAVTVSKILQGTAGQVLMTNGTPDTAWTTLSGDVTVSNTGVTSIGSGVIEVGDFAAGAKPVVICTSSTRPTTGVVEGQPIYETDTNRILTASSSVPAWELVGGNVPRCRLTKSTTQAIGTGVATAITFQTEEFDDGGLHSSSVNNPRITIPTGGDGTYMLGCHVEFANNATGIRTVLIVVNGTTTQTTVRDVSPSASDASRLACSTLQKLAAGDYVEVQVVQTSGGNLNVASTCNFWALWQAP